MHEKKRRVIIVLRNSTRPESEIAIKIHELLTARTSPHLRFCFIKSRAQRRALLEGHWLWAASGRMPKCIPKDEFGSSFCTFRNSRLNFLKNFQPSCLCYVPQWGQTLFYGELLLSIGFLFIQTSLLVKWTVLKR